MCAGARRLKTAVVATWRGQKIIRGGGWWRAALSLGQNVKLVASVFFAPNWWAQACNIFDT
jgi:hypothetical protein